MSTPPTQEQTLNVDQRVILHGVSWRTYEAILAVLAEESVVLPGLKLATFARLLSLGSSRCAGKIKL
ncbi:MAG: hypothetical protein ACT4TC_19525 [Myxococcaceae bacterium]